MEDKERNEFDFLNYTKDLNVRETICRGETIYFSDKIQKINKYGWSQERNIIITDKAIYNLKKNVCKRIINLKVIRGITVSKISDEFVIHGIDEDYDYYYSSQKKKTIINIINTHYFKETGNDLKLFELPEKKLKNYVTSQSEKKKDKNISKMPKKGMISISEYIYGSKQIVKVNQKESVVKKTGVIYSSNEVNINDFEVLKVIGRGSIGKILLVKYNKTKDLYTIKNMRKDQIISEGIVDNILEEKNILSEGKCDFLLSLSFFFQSEERIFFVTPFIRGGDLYHLLKKEGILNENLVKFFTGQIAIGLQHMHDFGIGYRDLKPENVLIDEDGYIKLCDFGSCIHFNGSEKEKSFAGSPEYQAPEIITNEGHDIRCDWWSFGILIYELLFGTPPFYSSDKTRMYELINLSDIKFKKSIFKGEEEVRIQVSEEAIDIIKKFLEVDPNKRLGKEGLDEITKHPFYANLNFDLLRNKKLKAPFKPTINTNEPTLNFDEEYLGLDIKDSPVANWINEYKSIFDDFDKKEEKNSDF